jgi:hypothetical protein
MYVGNWKLTQLGKMFKIFKSSLMQSLGFLKLGNAFKLNFQVEENLIN